MEYDREEVCISSYSAFDTNTSAELTSKRAPEHKAVEYDEEELCFSSYSTFESKTPAELTAALEKKMDVEKFLAGLSKSKRKVESNGTQDFGAGKQIKSTK